MADAETTHATKRSRTDEGPQAQPSVRSSSASPERLALRKTPDRQNLWEKGEQDLPEPPAPTVRAPSEDDDTFPYIKELDPAYLAKKPLYRGVNPHFQMSHSGAQPPLPLPPHRPFPEGPFPVAPIHPGKLTSNLSLAQEKEIARIRNTDFPHTVIALVPHGAGKAINANASKIARDCQDFLRSLAFEANDNKPYKVMVHPLGLRNKTGANSNAPFGMPWTFIIQIPNNALPLYDFLMWQRVFGVSKTVSFTAYDFEGTRDLSWILFPITGNVIEPEATHMEVLEQKLILTNAICEAVETNTVYRSYAAKLAYTNLKHTGDLAGTLRTIAGGFHLERTEAEDAKGNLVPAYLFMARPPTTLEREYNDWKSFFLLSSPSQKRFSLSAHLQTFDVAAPSLRIWCELCKSHLHCTARCPLPTADGWLGINPRDLGVRAISLNPPRYEGPPGIVPCAIIQKFRTSQAETKQAEQAAAGGGGTPSKTRGGGRTVGGGHTGNGTRGRGPKRG
ncbi:hypothetical protein C2E23DRAFT_738614 [Lenzites betulinus]|nr:hypothetical protein C2E23DRAFT_738614 [Lenzites betulinus]